MATAAAPPHWGRSLWSLLHRIGTRYPEASPGAAAQQHAAELLRAYSVLLPCSMCTQHWAAMLASRQHEVAAALQKGRRALAALLAALHNAVNARLHKAHVPWAEATPQPSSVPGDAAAGTAKGAEACWLARDGSGATHFLLPRADVAASAAWNGMGSAAAGVQRGATPAEGGCGVRVAEVPAAADPLWDALVLLASGAHAAADLAAYHKVMNAVLFFLTQERAAATGGGAPGALLRTLVRHGGVASSVLHSREAVEQFLERAWRSAAQEDARSQVPAQPLWPRILSHYRVTCSMTACGVQGAEDGEDPAPNSPGTAAAAATPGRHAAACPCTADRDVRPVPRAPGAATPGRIAALIAGAACLLLLPLLFWSMLHRRCARSSPQGDAAAA